MTDDRAKLGAEMRARLWGPNPPRSAMPERIARYTNDHLFGDVWQGDERSGEAG